MDKLQKEVYKSYCKSIMLPVGTLVTEVGKVFFGIAKDTGKVTCDAFIDGIDKSIKECKASEVTFKKITKKSKKSSYSFEFDQKI